MDDKSHREELNEELAAQLENTLKVRYILDADESIVTLSPGEYVLDITDVKFEDGVIKVELRL